MSTGTNTNAGRRKQRQGGSYYIDNPEFEELIKLYRETNDEHTLNVIVTDFFYVLAYHIIVSARFSMIDDEDALQDAVIACFRKMPKFDASRGKAFNFFTTVIFNQLRGMFKSSKNYYQLKRSFLKCQALKLDTGSANGRRLITYLRERGYFDEEHDVQPHTTADSRRRWARE